jgi:hypothetical protein
LSRLGESNPRSDAHRCTIWGVKGETPMIAKTGSRFSLNLISAGSPMGELRFMVTDQQVNAATFIDFLRRMLVNAERPIYLVLGMAIRFIARRRYAISSRRKTAN